MIWNKPKFEIAASSTASLTDLTSYVRALSINEGAVANNAQYSGADTEINEPGLKTWSLTVAFNQSSTGVDAVLNPLNGGNCYIRVRRDSTGSVSTSNPQRAGNGMIAEYTPHEGDMGVQDVATLTIASRGTLTRTTST